MGFDNKHLYLWTTTPVKREDVSIILCPFVVGTLLTHLHSPLCPRESR